MAKTTGKGKGRGKASSPSPGPGCKRTRANAPATSPSNVRRDTVLDAPSPPVPVGVAATASRDPSGQQKPSSERVTGGASSGKKSRRRQVSVSENTSTDGAAEAMKQRASASRPSRRASVAALAALRASTAPVVEIESAGEEEEEEEEEEAEMSDESTSESAPDLPAAANRTTEKKPRRGRPPSRGDKRGSGNNEKAKKPAASKGTGGVRDLRGGKRPKTAGNPGFRHGFEDSPRTTREEDLGLVLALFQEHEGLLAVRARMRREIVALQQEEDELRSSLGLPAVHPVVVPLSPPRTVVETTAVPAQAPVTSNTVPQTVSRPTSGSCSNPDATSGVASATSQSLEPVLLSDSQGRSNGGVVLESSANENAELEKIMLFSDDDGNDEDVVANTGLATPVSMSGADAGGPRPGELQAGHGVGTGMGSGRGRGAGLRGNTQRKLNAARGRGGQAAIPTRGSGSSTRSRGKPPTKFSQIGADAQVKFRPSGRGGASRRGMGSNRGRGHGANLAAPPSTSGIGGRDKGSLRERGDR